MKFKVGDEVILKRVDCCCIFCQKALGRVCIVEDFQVLNGNTFYDVYRKTYKRRKIYIGRTVGVPENYLESNSTFRNNIKQNHKI